MLYFFDHSNLVKIVGAHNSVYWAIGKASFSKASGALSSISILKDVAGIESFTGTAWNPYLEPSASTGLTIVIFESTHDGAKLCGCLIKAVNFNNSLA